MAFLADQNWNMHASSLLIAVCRRFGSDTFFVSPGYRDAPFIAALKMHEGIHLISCWDERAAAFQALGWSKARGKPAVLICTSGTAGANYLPAVIEARTDHIPLLVITADRPFDLVFASAQQVIDQRDLFGRFVKKTLDFPAPSRDLNARAWISYVRMLLETATEDRPGPVHMNLPFSGPLDPVVHEQRPTPDQVRTAEAAIEQLRFDGPLLHSTVWSRSLQDDFIADIERARRGLLLIGRLQESSDREAIRSLRDKLGWPVFADIGSGLKFELSSEFPDLNLPQSREWIARYAPDCVVHVGKRLVSRYFDDSLARWDNVVYWVLSDDEHIQDPYHLPQRRQHRPNFMQILAQLSRRELNVTLRNEVEALNRSLALTPSPSFNFRDVAEVILDTNRGPLFLGNSTAIRAFDSWCFGSRGNRPSAIMANRGVSGIEGLLATTLGAALATGSAWTLVIGDIAMLHDLNSILSLSQSPAQVIVVIVNNAGGRIFETLPVQKFPWVKDPLISTPHSFTFEGVSAMAGLVYGAAQDRESFGALYGRMLSRGVSCIIECKQDPEADLNFTRALAAQEITHDPHSVPA